MKIYPNKKLLIIAYIFAFLLGMIGWQESVLANDPGDQDGDGWVTLDDLAIGLSLAVAWWPDRAPAAMAPYLDVADANGQGLVGIGDGWVDYGDIAFMGEVISTWCPGYFNICPALPPSFTPTTAGAEIGITVNGEPWDQVSPVSPNDVIKFSWFGTDTFAICDAYWPNFCNFNLNLSKGEYLFDFVGCHFILSPDGQGGINFGIDDFLPLCDVSPVEIFSFSFRIPDVNGPAYTIDIRPNRGSYRLIMYDQLPYVQLQVSAKGPQCINPPQYDLNGDCKVDFRDLALLASEWLFCGYDDPSACEE